MKRGYIHLWRKVTDKKDWPGNERRAFTEFEARIDAYMNLARGTDNETLMRGEFLASDRFLAKRWDWSKTKAHRWKEKMFASGELKRVNRKVDHLLDHPPDHLKLTKYNVWNPLLDHPPDHKADQNKEGLKKYKENTLKIITHWNSHKCLRGCMGKGEQEKAGLAIVTQLEDGLSVGDLKLAADHYAFAWKKHLEDSEGWWCYKWTLADFLTRDKSKWLRNCLDSDWKTYFKRAGVKPKKEENPWGQQP